MTTEHNKQIESIPANLEYPIIHQIERLDPTHSIETIFIAVMLINRCKNLWVSIERIRQQGKFDPKVLFQILGVILAILRAIAQMGD
jgi:hypothetical protein